MLAQLRNVIDPDFGEDIVACGFVRELAVDPAAGTVSFTLELTTPACPVKEMFQRQSTEFVKVRGGARGVGLGEARLKLATSRRAKAALMRCEGNGH